MNCSSVDEAKKRALILAYLTYDVRQNNFVQLNSSNMMLNPHIMNKMFKLLSNFGLDLENDDKVDLKSTYALQSRQQHSGLICSEKDLGDMRYQDRYKSLLLNRKVLIMSVKNDREERQMERE